MKKLSIPVAAYFFLLAFFIPLVLGLIYLKKTLPSSVAVHGQQQSTTDNWKTYRNEKYGFEVKYPLTAVAGLTADNSQLGVGGIYIGPLVFVVADNVKLREETQSFFNNYFNYVEDNLSEGPGIGCERNEIPSSVLNVKAVSCGGEGGRAFYGFIDGKDYDIFIDGYPESRLYNSTNFVESEGYFSDKEEIIKLLSTFKFIDTKVADSIFYEKKEGWGPCPTGTGCFLNTFVYRSGKVVFESTSTTEEQIDSETVDSIIQIIKDLHLMTKDCSSLPVTDYGLSTTITLNGETRSIIFPGCSEELGEIDKLLRITGSSQ